MVVLLRHKTVHKDDTGINAKKLYKCHQSRGTEYKLFTITKHLFFCFLLDVNH